MKQQKQNHLKEEQVIWAVIDEHELTGEDRQHLLECQLCSGKVARFKAELQELGENARMSVPPQTRTIRLPIEEPAKPSAKSSWLPSFAAAALAGFILFFYFLGTETMTPRMIALQSPESFMEDEYLMDEIFEMVENPFSDVIYEITGENGGYDDEFLQFIIPDDTQDDFQS